KAAGVSARVMAWHARDVMAVEIDDQRTSPQPIEVNLRMLRYLSQDFGGALEKMIASHTVTVRTRHHAAASTLSTSADRIILSQEFREGTHVAKSAVAIGMRGRPALPRFSSDTEIRLSAAANR